MSLTAPSLLPSTLQNFIKATPAKDEDTAAATVAALNVGTTPAASTAERASALAAGTSTTPTALPYHDLFSPPPAECCAAPVTATTEELDAALAAAKGAPQAETLSWEKQLRRRWRGLRPQAPRIFGDPPHS